MEIKVRDAVAGDMEGIASIYNEAENQASIGLHKKLGFEYAGCMKEVGTKFGKWLDLVFMQLQLDTRRDPD